MRFKSGQEVVCTKKGTWNVIYGIDGPMDGPKFNQIVTVRGYVLDFVTFMEYPENQGYTDTWFEPVITTEELHEALQEIAVYETAVISEEAD